MRTNRRKPSQTLTKIMSSITEQDRRHTRNRMLIAVKIADALEAKNLSNKDFAKLMGKSESEISEWLSGNRNFTVDTLSDISNCLGIQLLSTSDMRTIRVTILPLHKKVAKTRYPYTYNVSGTNTFHSTAPGWSKLDNNTIATA